LTQPETKAFVPYLDMPTRLPSSLWWVLRVLTLAATLGMMVELWVEPQRGLDLFWKVLVPLLPFVFVVAPGLWRQVCPMALVNQIPRMAGFSLGRTLPVGLKTSAFLIAALTFVAAVATRHLLFNGSALAVFILLAAALGLAFAGGLVFKGRSGWCGTFCPLAPIQKAYGQAPLVVVRNGYCPSCVGCQKNCYDFNPRAAMHTDLADADPWYAGHRALFAAALPGLIVAFFTARDPYVVGIDTYILHLVTGIAMALGAFMALTHIMRVTRYKAVLLFSAAAFVLFYWFSSPLLTSGITEFTGISFPGLAAYIFFPVALVVGAQMIREGARNERLYEEVNPPAGTSVGVQVDALHAAVDSDAAGMVTDRGSGLSFAADPGRSLLEGLESTGVKIDFGCRMGLCGADPIAIVDGGDCLSEPTTTELDTLERLGLKGRARMACVCRALKGTVIVDTVLDPRSLPEPEVETPAVDIGEETGIRRVVILGNGAAGMTAADEVRKFSRSCSITLVARERDNFYNRMAIGRLLYGRSALGGLVLQVPGWEQKKDISLWLNTTAVAIDRAAHSVQLGTGETLEYDKLILAQGSSSVMPPIPGSEIPGCFVLREAGDAMDIRSWRQTHACRTAVVLGGGVLGIEAADALRQLNLSVTILQRASRLMDRQLDERGSAILTSYLENLGMTVVIDAQVSQICGEQRVTGVALEGGDILEADIVVACAGIRPNIEIAREAGLEVARGVRIDRAMRTSDPDIFAIGDVAELPGSIGGLWAVSTAQGRIAAAAVFGRDINYVEPSTLVSLKMEGIDVKGYGLTAAEQPGQEVIVAPSEADNEHRMLVIEDGRVAGAVFVGPPGTCRYVADLIEQRPDLHPILDDLRRGNWDSLASVLN
jgi:nitrite reductase (NADH) large subunit